jgi:hypothetical protein
MRAEIGAGRGQAGAAGHVAEIDIEILELRGPVADDRAFDACAGRPADIRQKR